LLLATRQQVEDHAKALNGLVVLARRDLAAWWATLDPADGVAVRIALEGFLPELVAAYGEQAALMSTEWYDELRELAPVTSRYRAQMADLPEGERVNARGRWAIGGLFGPEANPAGVLALLGGLTDELVKQPGRDSIALACALDPEKPRWARVPVGKTCAFCLMLASRGAVYESKAAARGKRGKYHGDCDCTPTPTFTGDDLPDDYDPDSLYAKYAEARSEAGPESSKAILSRLRQQEGSH
jgi:hypothetical protein